jgi:P-type Ca2+ transporter type 2C
LISVYDILVGDILFIEAGDVVPVDGILAEGYNFRCDESSATGESNTVEKVPADIALERFGTGGDLRECDPFIISDTRVLEGIGRYVVTAVGTNSCHGRMMLCISTRRTVQADRLAFHDEPEDTPLQIRLNRIADMIATWGGGIALLLFIILLIQFASRLPGSDTSPSQKGEHFMQILIVSVSLVVVAVPEGLPLAVTLSLAYATIRMIQDNNLVRVLKACETVGNATTICSDKTGTLTENKMTIVAGTLGTTGFERYPIQSASGEGQGYHRENNIFSPNTNIQSFFSILPDPLTSLLRDSIALNSTAFESKDRQGKELFIGSKTEAALLEMAKNYLGLDDVATERENAKSRQVQLFPFNSERKIMGVVVKTDVHGHTMYRLFIKGASEVILQHSKGIIDLSNVSELGIDALTADKRQLMSERIERYAPYSLRTIALAYRDFDIPHWPPIARATRGNHTQARFEDVFDNMVFIGIFGIRDPLRPGITQAVRDCRKAGVVVRMVTGDNVLTAKAVASECGIYTDGIIMEGPEFRKLSRRQMEEILPRLQVLARSSPDDKRMLVKRLKHFGEIVAVTGDGTNDGPALHAADVGFSMGIAGTEVAKAASAIVLMDDNFASIVKAIAWGRCVNDSVKKFLQVY